MISWPQARESVSQFDLVAAFDVGSEAAERELERVLDGSFAGTVRSDQEGEA